MKTSINHRASLTLVLTLLVMAVAIVPAAAQEPQRLPKKYLEKIHEEMVATLSPELLLQSEDCYWDITTELLGADPLIVEPDGTFKATASFALGKHGTCTEDPGEYTFAWYVAGNLVLVEKTVEKSMTVVLQAPPQPGVYDIWVVIDPFRASNSNGGIVVPPEGYTLTRTNSWNTELFKMGGGAPSEEFEVVFSGDPDNIHMCGWYLPPYTYRGETLYLSSIFNYDEDGRSFLVRGLWDEAETVNLYKIYKTGAFSYCFDPPRIFLPLGMLRFQRDNPWPTPQSVTLTPEPTVTVGKITPTSWPTPQSVTLTPEPTATLLPADSTPTPWVPKIVTLTPTLL